MIRRALISVSDKRGIADFARGLSSLGVEIVSTGGTAKLLSDVGVPVRSISELTGFPEVLDGRVKTLHPNVHGGLLARRDLSEHMATLERHGIAPIDLLCVNLYPFAETIADPNVALAEAIENIDIGGPAMVRSAAKNHDSVTVLVDASDYERVLAEMRENAGSTTLETRRRLAAKAYAHTAYYDSMIAAYLRKTFCPDELFPVELTLGYRRVQMCRYGENPHQLAAVYREPHNVEPCVANAVQLHGKELSFNNFLDANAALETVKEFPEGPAAVIIKHGNPCGVAIGEDIAAAFERAREGDPVSAFGGILAVNQEITVEAARAITGKNCFFEAVIAPGFAEEALPVLTESKRWGADLRLLQTAPLTNQNGAREGYDTKKIVGGLLVQQRDLRVQTPDGLTVVTQREPTAEEVQELLFAWRVVRHVKSNAIALTRGRQVVGIGAGQMNRVQSVRLAVGQAGDKAQGAVMASDAFFPFPDGPEVAADAGITAIIQPGGSKKDQETIDLCNRRGIAMVFTGARHFLH